MTIETRLRKLEDTLKVNGDKKCLTIFQEADETEAEAIKRFEAENGIKIDESKHDLNIIHFISFREDLEIARRLDNEHRN